MTSYDYFIRRPEALDHREKAPTHDDARKVCEYITAHGVNADEKEIFDWLYEEHLDYLLSLTTWNN